MFSIREKDTNKRLFRHKNEQVIVDGRPILFKKQSETQFLPYIYVDNGTEHEMDCFKKTYYKRSGLYEDYMMQEGNDTIIGIISVSASPYMSWLMYDVDVKKDQLFSLNVSTGESSILYDTKNSSTRIIGYKDGTIYLFDTTYKVYSQKLDGTEKKEICTVPQKEEIIFDWQGDYLIIETKGRNEENRIEPYEIKAVKINHE